MSYTPGRPPYLTGNYGFPVPGGTGLADYLTANRAFADKLDAQLKVFEDILDGLAVTAPTLVANLPTTGLVDGQEVYYQTGAMATAGAIWHLRYRAAAPSATRWEFLGGSPVEQTINGGAGGSGIWTGPLASGLNPVPDGPSVVVPRPGDYLLSFGATVQNPAGTSVDIGVGGGGLAADAAPMLQFRVYNTEPVGTIRAYAGRTVPAGWMLADGRSLVRTDYPALFATISTVYGAADAAHFSLPDLRSRFLYGSASPSLSDVGTVGGEATHVLSAAEMPSHTHGYSDMWAEQVIPNAFNDYTPIPGFTAVSGWGGPSALATGAAGGGGAHNNLPPYVLIAQIIKVIADPGESSGSLTVRRNVATANSTLAMWASPSADGAMVGARYLSVTPIRLG